MDITDKYAYVRGFNYHPSYAWNSYEEWRFFNPKVYDKEIGRGKKFFPKMNTIRLWLSYDAFRYEPDRQAKNFETALKICDKYGCKVVVVLFNCWHDEDMDNGGIYLPQMIPGSIWSAKETMYDSYFEKIVKPHANDQRILIWDICNEAFSNGDNEVYCNFAKPYETAWLKKMYRKTKEAGATQPVALSLCGQPFDQVNDYTDVFMIHPYGYFTPDKLQYGMDLVLDEIKNCKEDAKRLGKPILSTETCWGSLDDKVHEQMIRYTLDAHKITNVGFIVHALQYSQFADLHDPCDGPVGTPGNLCFVTKKGKIRKGCEIFNEY